MMANANYRDQTATEATSAAMSILARLENVARLLSDHVDTLRGVESSAIGDAPPVTEAIGGPKAIFSHGGFLGQLDQAVSKIESEMPRANAIICRVRNAF